MPLTITRIGDKFETAHGTIQNVHKQGSERPSHKQTPTETPVETYSENSRKSVLKVACKVGL